MLEGQKDIRNNEDKSNLLVAASYSYACKPERDGKEAKHIFALSLWNDYIYIFYMVPWEFSFSIEIKHNDI